MRNQELSRKHRESVLNSVSERQSTRGKFRFSLFSALLGLLFLAASLTPSLIPRDPAIAGIYNGVIGVEHDLQNVKRKTGDVPFAITRDKKLLSATLHFTYSTYVRTIKWNGTCAGVERAARTTSNIPITNENGFV